MKVTNYIYTLFCFLLLSQVGCREDQGIGEDPYAGGKEPLGIQLSSKLPTPNEAYPGDEVVFGAKGLLQWSKPEVGKYDFDFFIADEKAAIKMVTDTSITVIVPPSVSSGISHILLKGQVFYGPRLNILGNVKVDKEYGIKSGPDGPVFNYLEHNSQKGSYYFVGGFRNIQNARRTQIAYVDARGNLAELNSTYYNVREPLRYSSFVGGVSGNSTETVSSMSYFNDGKIVLSGTFEGYESKEGSSYVYPEVNNITVLNNNSTLDTVGVSVKPYFGTIPVIKYVPPF
jgi:hypothetical protein